MKQLPAVCMYLTQIFLLYCTVAHAKFSTHTRIPSYLYTDIYIDISPGCYHLYLSFHFIFFLMFPNTCFHSLYISFVIIIFFSYVLPTFSDLRTSSFAISLFVLLYLPHIYVFQTIFSLQTLHPPF